MAPEASATSRGLTATRRVAAPRNPTDASPAASRPTDPLALPAEAPCSSPWRAQVTHMAPKRYRCAPAAASHRQAAPRHVVAGTGVLVLCALLALHKELVT